MSIIMTRCPRCNIIPRLVFSHNVCQWVCLCPPVQTFTTNSSLPIQQKEQKQ